MAAPARGSPDTAVQSPLHTCPTCKSTRGHAAKVRGEASGRPWATHTTGTGTHLLCPQPSPTAPATVEANQATLSVAGGGQVAWDHSGLWYHPGAPGLLPPWHLPKFHSQPKSQESHQYTWLVRIPKEKAQGGSEPGLTAGSQAPAENLPEKPALWRS